MPRCYTSKEDRTIHTIDRERQKSAPAPRPFRPLPPQPGERVNVKAESVDPRKKAEEFFKKAGL
jgi:hypothetical protein